MIHVLIKKQDSQELIAEAKLENPESFIEQGIKDNAWGLSARWVEDSEDLQLSEVIEIEEIDGKTMALLRPEYVIEMIDITAEHELEQVINKRKAEYPTFEQFMEVFFDGSAIDMEDLRAFREQIKLKYPKPQ